MSWSFFFFFNQKPAYEMLSSDWSSDVCSSDLASPVGTPAMLAPALCTPEPDQPRQFGPVDRVEPAMFGHDRHDDSMSQASRERKQKIGCGQRRSVLASLTARFARAQQNALRFPRRGCAANP